MNRNMASASPKECGVCNEEFDEERRCPRILPCAHCICNDCIEKLITNNMKSCPFCRQEFQGNSARDFGRNINLLDLMKHTADLEMYKLSLQKCPENSSKRLEEIKKDNEHVFHTSIKELRDLESEINIAIQRNCDLMQTILHDIGNIENHILKNMNEVLSRCHQKFDILRARHISMLKRQQEIIAMSDQLHSVKENFESAKTFKDVGNAIDEAENTNFGVQILRQNSSVAKSRDDKERQLIEKTVTDTQEKLESIQEILSSIERAYENKPVKSDTSPVKRFFKKYVSAEDLRKRSFLVKCLLRNRQLFAFQHLYGIKRCAKISIIKGKKVCLHHLTEDLPPTSAYVSIFQDVINLVNPLKRLTFLDLSIDGRSLGRLVISLNPENELADRFFCQCLGANGQSYGNTNLFCVQKKDTEEEFVLLSDYENKGIPQQTGLIQQKGHCKQWVAGTLIGIWRSTPETIFNYKVAIITKNRPNMLLTAAFGKVEKGQDILTHAISKYPDINVIKISDCGSILPSKE